MTFFSRVPRFFVLTKLFPDAACIAHARTSARKLAPKFVVRFFYPSNFSTCCVMPFFFFFLSSRFVSFFFFFGFFKHDWDNTPEHVLVISRVNARLFFVAWGEKKVRKTENGREMKTNCLRANYRNSLCCFISRGEKHPFTYVCVCVCIFFL